MDGVVRTLGYQCPLGGMSPKPTSWVTFGVDLSAMPSCCPHPKLTWHNQRTGAVVDKPHAPTAGKDVYLLTKNVLAPKDRPWPTPSGPGQSPAPWVAQQLTVTKITRRRCPGQRSRGSPINLEFYYSVVGPMIDLTPCPTCSNQWRTSSPRTTTLPTAHNLTSWTTLCGTHSTQRRLRWNM